MEPLKENIAAVKLQIFLFIMLFSPSNIMETIDKAKKMTPLEIALSVLTGGFWTLYGVGFFIIRIMTKISGFLLYLMRGAKEEKKKTTESEMVSKKSSISKFPLHVGSENAIVNIKLFFYDLEATIPESETDRQPSSQESEGSGKTKQEEEK